MIRLSHERELTVDSICAASDSTEEDEFELEPVNQQEVSPPQAPRRFTREEKGKGRAVEVEEEEQEEENQATAITPSESESS